VEVTSQAKETATTEVEPAHRRRRSPECGGYGTDRLGVQRPRPDGGERRPLKPGSVFPEQIVVELAGLPEDALRLGVGEFVPGQGAPAPIDRQYGPFSQPTALELLARVHAPTLLFHLELGLCPDLALVDPAVLDLLPLHAAKFREEVDLLLVVTKLADVVGGLPLLDCRREDCALHVADRLRAAVPRGGGTLVSRRTGRTQNERAQDEHGEGHPLHGKPPPGDRLRCHN
jgi:hypothetical protein